MSDFVTRPMGIPLILITVLREEETPVEIGSAYFDPQEFMDQDGQGWALLP